MTTELTVSSHVQNNEFMQLYFHSFQYFDMTLFKGEVVTSVWIVDDKKKHERHNKEMMVLYYRLKLYHFYFVELN